MERMKNVGYGGRIGKFRPEQIAHQSTWTKVPENERQVASYHVIHVVPSNGSTETIVNPTDPQDDSYAIIPGANGTLVPAGRCQ